MRGRVRPPILLPPPLYKTLTILFKRLFYLPSHGLHLRDVTSRRSRHSWWPHHQVSTLVFDSPPPKTKKLNRTQRVPATDLVTGDIVKITLGSKVPADMRILSCSSDLRFDRSILTGESNPISAAVDATDPNCKPSFLPFFNVLVSSCWLFFVFDFLIFGIYSHGNQEHLSPRNAMHKWERYRCYRRHGWFHCIWTYREAGFIRANWTDWIADWDFAVCDYHREYGFRCCCTHHQWVFFLTLYI